MAKKYKVGYTDGVYDLFHTGHLNMIETAKSQCEHLIVGVHGDDVVEGYKHRRPIINEEGRRRIIASVADVDEAVITRFRDKMKLWEKYHFDVIFIGDDWKGTERWNRFEKELAKIGVEVVYVPYTKGISTTEIRERIMLGNRKKIAITMGDPAGIGAEIIVKSLAREEVYHQCIPIVIGDRAALEDALGFCNLELKLNEIREPKEATGHWGTIDFINLGLLQPQGWEYKKNSALCGDASFQYVIKGIELAKAKQVDAVATAPINKESLHMGGHKYSGHTEIFAEYTNTPKYAMLLASGIR
uniref:4-hydroxythreonine-4-phosphate dehydrogenase PdxA n=1 Tax=Selenomonas sp. TaxID=2053611 RepID=UPI0025CD41E7